MTEFKYSDESGIGIIVARKILTARSRNLIDFDSDI